MALWLSMSTSTLSPVSHVPCFYRPYYSHDYSSHNEVLPISAFCTALIPPLIVIASCPRTPSNTPRFPDIKPPTLSSLNAAVPADLDVRRVASNWFSAFSAALDSKDERAVAGLLLPESFWRDFLALTWDFRTFVGRNKIVQFLKDRLSTTGIRNIKLKDDYLELQQPYDNLAWINTIFDFDTSVSAYAQELRV